MLVDVVEVEPRGGHRLYVRFEDGTAGEVDLATRVTFDGIFASLRDPARFAEASVHADLGTVVWPNGADIDPDVLYAWVRGEPKPDLTGKGAADEE